MLRRKRRICYLVASLGLFFELGRVGHFALNTLHLFVATAKGRDDEVRRLVRSGAFINVELQGRTPLDYAVQRCKPETVAFLLVAGADPDFKHSVDARTSRKLAVRWRPDLMPIFDRYPRN